MLAKKTYQDIMELGPCFDPATGIDTEGEYHCEPVCTETWEGTALDILKADGVSIDDKFWVITNEGWVPDDVFLEFARWCALQVIHLWDGPDVVREYLETGAEEKRAAAWDAAWDAARAAARAAARDAAWDAAWDAARAAARDAARDAQLNKLIELLENLEK